MPSNHTLFAALAIVAVGSSLLAAPVSAQSSSSSRTRQGQSQGQGQGQSEGGGSQGAIDAATAKALNTAIEALNMEKYAEAQAAIDMLKLDKLSPYEHSKVEQILFNIAYAQEKYDEARAHLQKSIDAGGLNEQEVAQARYQSAQLYLTQEKWKEGAAALEDWFKTAQNPNSAAYYLLAVAYYQLQDYGRALPNAKKAIELTDKPQESWLQLLLALYLQKDQYKDAIPLLTQLVQTSPEKKTYWMQLSAVYGQVEDFKSALAVMQLAYGSGLLTEETEFQRLADLLVFNEVPYRGGQVLEKAIKENKIQGDEKTYEKLADCWIASGELDKAVDPLQKGGELAATGDLFVRLGEVHAQRQDWEAAKTSIQRGIDKGKLKDTGAAQLMMGIVLFNEKKLGEARTWFARAQQAPKQRNIAENYVKVIDAQVAQEEQLKEQQSKQQEQKKQQEEAKEEQSY